MRRSLGLAFAAFLLWAPGTRAEVSALVDPSGSFQGLHVERDARSGNIWEKVTDLPDRQVLNAFGARIGDGEPTEAIIAMPLDDPGQSMKDGTATTFNKRRSALVVWPRYDGTDLELVYSLWDPRSKTWRTPAYVERRDDGLDDVEPYLCARDTRVYLSWRVPAELTVYWVARGFVVDGGSPDVQWEEPQLLTASTVIDGLDIWALRGMGAPDPGNP